MWQPNYATLQSIQKNIIETAKNKRIPRNLEFFKCLDAYKEDPQLLGYLLLVARNLGLQKSLRTLVFDFILDKFKTISELPRNVDEFIQQFIVTYLDDHEISLQLSLLAGLSYSKSSGSGNIITILSNKLDYDYIIFALNRIFVLANPNKIEQTTNVEALRKIAQKLLGQVKNGNLKAIYCMNSFIALNLQVIESYIPNYLEKLISLNSDSDEFINAIGCGFLSIGTMNKNILGANYNNCAKIMIKGLDRKQEICCKFFVFSIASKMPIYPFVVILLEKLFENISLDSSNNSIRQASQKLIKHLAIQFKDMCFNSMLENMDNKLHSDN